MKVLIFLLAFSICSQVISQNTIDSLSTRIEQLEHQNTTLKYMELVQSMSQRSLLMPAYFPETKALVARQAYNFWSEYEGNPLVSHLNVYSALYYANKYLGYDSINRLAYNQALGHNQSVISIHVGDNPNFFYSAGSDGKVLKWSFSERSKIPEIIYEGKHLIRSIDLSNNDQWVLVVTKDQGIILVNNDTNKEMNNREVIKDPERVQTAAFIPGEAKILTVDQQGNIKIKGFDRTIVKGNVADDVTSLQLNAKTKDVYVGTKTGKLQIWEDTLAAKIYLPESFAINSLAISPDFSMLALGREKGDVILWDLNEEKFIRKISGHQSAITDVDFSPDNELLLTASRDRTVRVWEIHNQQKLPLVLDDHEDWVMTAAFSPDGQKIISGSRDNYIRFWTLDLQVLADRICGLIDREMTDDEWNNYIGQSIPKQPTCLSH